VQIHNYLCREGYYTFLFKLNQMRNSSLGMTLWFLGPCGMYLNKWMLNFNPKEDIPIVVPIWVRLLHFPLVLWDDETFEAIGNKLGSTYTTQNKSWSICICVDLCRGKTRKGCARGHQTRHETLDTYPTIGL
jgi:hypothetical protein